uniref:Hexosyltransferase n=1 Tax=Tetranychus urticae TaxID=32264 RepID=T1KZE0_TETUR
MSMLPFETPTIFEQLPKYFFSVPKVVSNQKEKFESDELLKRLSRESEIRFVGYKDRDIVERRVRFINGLKEATTEIVCIVFTPTGTNLQLVFNSCANGFSDYFDFEKERGKVHFKSSFIMNGVCVNCKGWIDLEKLEGIGCLEYDQERGAIEDALVKENIERFDTLFAKANGYSNTNLMNRPSDHRTLYWGYFDGDAPVKRQGKWTEDNWFLCDKYLPYALGGGYVISSSLVKYIVTNSHLLSLYHNEDVNMGVWLASLNITRQHDPRFDTEYKSRGCSNNFLVSHRQNINDMREKYDNQNNLVSFVNHK